MRQSWVVTVSCINRAIIGKERWVFAFEGTDISGNGGGSANYQWTAGENRWSDWWLTTYQAICACNVTITRLGMSAIDSEGEEKLLAEARFLRAFYYYHALTYWGSPSVER